MTLKTLKKNLSSLGKTTKRSFTSRELAELAGVSPFTVLHDISDNKLRVRKGPANKRPRYSVPKASVKKYLAKRIKRLSPR